MVWGKTHGAATKTVQLSGGEKDGQFVVIPYTATSINVSGQQYQLTSKLTLQGVPIFEVV